MNAQLRATVLTGILALASACSKGETTAPPKPASVAASATTTLAGTVGTALAAPPAFVVRDAAGNVLDNVAVTIVVTAGGGVLTGAPTKSSGGPTSVGTWTLGTTAGTNVLTVTVSGLPPLTFTATGTPDVPIALTVVSGNNQVVSAGAQVPQAISFKVGDKFGNGVPNTTVTFQVTAGEGFLSGSLSVPTDLNGVASAPPWTLGRINIPQQISATAGALSATATANVSSLYHAEVRFFGPTPDPNFAAAFTRAVNKINAEIVGQLPPQPIGIPPDAPFNVAAPYPQGCGTTGVAPLSETIGTMVVFVTIKQLQPGILGSSGPCIVRSTNRLTVIGTMTFSVTFIQQLYNNNQLNDVALHEIQHVLGFGTLWDFVIPPVIINAGTPQTAFIGALGISACLQLGGGAANCTPGIPLEYGVGAGSDDGHWRKTIFNNELMTYRISAVGTLMPLSVMTIASLADLGYTVNNNVADPYVVTSSVASLLATVRAAQGLAVEEGREELLAPRFEATRDGRVTKLK